MARSNWKRRQAGTKFDGYIYFFFPGEGVVRLRTHIAYCIQKKGRKMKKERKKIKKKCLRGSPLTIASARRFHSVSKIRAILPRPEQNKAPAKTSQTSGGKKPFGGEVSIDILFSWKISKRRYVMQPVKLALKE